MHYVCPRTSSIHLEICLLINPFLTKEIINVFVLIFYLIMKAASFVFNNDKIQNKSRTCPFKIARHSDSQTEFISWQSNWSHAQQLLLILKMTEIPGRMAAFRMAFL